MATAQYDLEQLAQGVGAPRRQRHAERAHRGARLRLLLAVAGLGALVAWGALSHIGSDSSVEGESATSAQDAPRYDGRGKWTGYTSQWRSRPQILRDAGVTQER